MADESTEQKVIPSIVTKEAPADFVWPTTTRERSITSPYKLAVQSAIDTGKDQLSEGFATAEEADKFRGALNTAANSLGKGLQSRIIKRKDGGIAVVWKVVAKRVRAEAGPATVGDTSTGTAPKGK